MDEVQVFYLDEPQCVAEVVDDALFSHVTDNGEVYELFEIISITREYLNHPQQWTHGVTVMHRDSNRKYSADIRVMNFSVDDSVVYDFSKTD